MDLRKAELQMRWLIAVLCLVFVFLAVIWLLGFWFGYWGGGNLDRGGRR